MADILNQHVRFGNPNATVFAPDFRWDDANHKLFTRSLILADIGDPSDFAMRRAGPDGAGPEATPEAVPPNTTLGVFYWSAFGSHGDWVGRNAQIYARARSDQGAGSAGGSLHLCTTTAGTPDLEDVLELEHDGTIRIGKNAVTYNLNGDPGKAGVRCWMPNGAVGYLMVQF